MLLEGIKFSDPPPIQGDTPSNKNRECTGQGIANIGCGHLGSNLERVIRSCTHPVLVASSATWPMERFVLAFDGGKSANKADLLVMGAYGHSRIRELIIGSTTTEMIRRTKQPVLLFR